MQAILLPIHPRHIEKILSGEKRVEFRKRGFQREVTHVVMYSTAPTKKVVGWFEVNFIYSNHPLVIWNTHKHEGCISEIEFFEYYKTTTEGVVIGIKNQTKTNPIPLSWLGIMKPPQNFYYLSEEQFVSMKNTNNQR